MADARLRLLDAADDADIGRFLAALDSLRPIVVLPAGLPEAAAGAALTLIALLSRLFPHLEVEGTAQAGPNPWGLVRVEDAVAGFRAVRPAPTAPAVRAVRLTIGAVPLSADLGAVLGIGGGDWTVRLAWSPQPLDDGAEGVRHGLGLHAAACLAVGELLKDALKPLGMAALALPQGDLTAADASLVWNLIDYRRVPSLAAHTGTGDRTRLHIVLAGAGSVGTSVVGMLALCPELRGDAVVVDPEEFDSTRNPFRYPVLLGSETGPKAPWAAAVLERAGWRAESPPGDLGNWSTSQAEAGFDGILISSVDDVSGRFDVADVLAREVISVGIGGLAFHVQRERLGDGWACPYCEYVTAEPPLTQAHLIAAQIGLPVERVIALQLQGAVLTEADLATCASTRKISPEASLRLRGHRLVDLIAGAYAEVALGAAAPPGSPSTAAKATGTVALAAPHVSWLTGVIVAAELLKKALGLPPLDRRVEVDMSGLPQGFTRRVRADTSGRCACASGVRRRWMLNLYGGRTANGTRA